MVGVVGAGETEGVAEEPGNMATAPAALPTSTGGGHRWPAPAPVTSTAGDVNGTSAGRARAPRRGEVGGGSRCDPMAADGDGGAPTCAAGRGGGKAPDPGEGGPDPARTRSEEATVAGATAGAAGGEGGNGRRGGEKGEKVEGEGGAGEVEEGREVGETGAAAAGAGEATGAAAGGGAGRGRVGEADLLLFVSPSSISFILSIFLCCPYVLTFKLCYL